MANIDNIKFNDTNKLDETSYYVIKLFILLYSIFFFFWHGSNSQLKKKFFSSKKAWHEISMTQMEMIKKDSINKQHKIWLNKSVIT
jgi:hypothetical protein